MFLSNAQWLTQCLNSYMFLSNAQWQMQCCLSCMLLMHSGKYNVYASCLMYNGKYNMYSDICSCLMHSGNTMFTLIYVPDSCTVAGTMFTAISNVPLLHTMDIIWVRPRNCGCLVTWFCYQLIAKPGNKTVTVSWPDPYALIYNSSCLMHCGRCSVYTHACSWPMHNGRYSADKHILYFANGMAIRLCHGMVDYNVNSFSYVV